MITIIKKDIFIFIINNCLIKKGCLQNWKQPLQQPIYKNYTTFTSKSKTTFEIIELEIKHAFSDLCKMRSVFSISS
ncbi:hypothetical protein IP97_00158 [Flavobacterium cheniae]|uniref:Uncharacterized protein n=1 Tax=Flavobacterium cheniae TaxID=295428 RepID=A0A562KS45_9FLAO|nr:hypothetical protein IP97_00158 [Flavobacterium cheniae]